MNVDMNCIITRNPVKVRSILIKNGAKNDEIDEKSGHVLYFSAKSLTEFLQNFAIGAVQKCVHLVDLEKR